MIASSESRAIVLEVVSSKQTKNCIDITLSESISAKIDGEKLFFKAYEINKNFKFNYYEGKIHIILDITKLDRHFLIYLTELFDKIIKDIF